VAFLRHHRLDVPPEDGSFDLVILHHVLEHVAEPLGLLRQLARSLRDGGVLFISVPRLDKLPIHRDYRYCLNGRTHVMGFSETCLHGLLARAGLTPTARLDDRLDVALTDGKPLRLRLIATRTAAPPRLPDAPLAPARRALHAYARTGGPTSRMRVLLPVRVRAALMNRAKKGPWQPD
jgi:SAM-dependent methyltransferase